MVRSMTSFGRAVREFGGKRYAVEIKSVNGKYLDFSIKYPRQYGFVESRIKSHVTSRGVTRGKIDCYLGVEVIEQQGVDITLDGALAASYIKALERLRDEFGLRDDISVCRVAAFHDIFNVTHPEEDTEAEWEAVRATLDDALDEFLAMREAEGARLCEDAKTKLEEIRSAAAEIKAISERNIETYPTRLAERITQLLEAVGVEAEITESRILTEAAIFADKAAIDEELVRLSSHLSAFYEIMDGEEAVGRKLDFLIQEINRETNTIGSKSQDTKIARLVVDIKCTVEKLREQIQNLE